MNDMSKRESVSTGSADPAFVVYDTETTGLFRYKDDNGNPLRADADGQPRMASFAAVVLDGQGNELDRHNAFVKPDGWSIDGTKAAEINGLTDAFLRENGVPVGHVLDLWEGWVKDGLTMIAFNDAFDTKVLRAELRRAGRPDHYEATKGFCAMKAMKAFADRGLKVGPRGNVKLSAVCEFFGIVNENAHDAMSDTDATVEIVRHLINGGHLGAPAQHEFALGDDANERAVIGGNNPPEEIDEDEQPAPSGGDIDAIMAQFADVLAETENWLDGAPVEDEAQMRAVDTLIKETKRAKKAVSEAEEAVAKPIYEAWKAEKARWKPTLDDLDLRIKGLVACVDGFKRKLAAQKAEAQRRAKEEADAALRASQEAHRNASANDYEAQLAAQAAEREAEIARIKAAQAAKDTVKGMRTVKRPQISDYGAAFGWIARHDKAAVDAFVEGYVQRNFANRKIDGVAVIEEKVAV